MKPDWCDEATWEKASWLVEAIQEHAIDGREELARALISAKNDGMEESIAILRAMHDEAWGIPEEQSALDRAEAAIRSRIQKGVA